MARNCTVLIMSYIFSGYCSPIRWMIVSFMSPGSSYVLAAIMLFTGSIAAQATDLTSDLLPNQHVTTTRYQDTIFNEMMSEQDKSEKSEKPSSGLKFGKDYVIVPLPVQSPTFGAGLVVSGAYYYKQTDEQKAVQPASLTGAAVAYTNSDSYAVGLIQQNYWDKDNWRFKGIISYLDFNLDIVDPSSAAKNEKQWFLSGELIQATFYRKLTGKWYIGLTGRYLDFTQSLTLGGVTDNTKFVIDEESQTAGFGLTFERDSRDLPSNAYTGSLFDIELIENQLAAANTSDYQSYAIRYRAYHHLAAPLVLAYDLNACGRSGNFPLWDSCRLKVRGFSATRYLSEDSASAQVEVRWKFYKKWGAVGFVGAGYVGNTFGGTFDNKTVPSYGVGLRWMVSDSQRLNLRLDYARSTDTDAWYFSAAEYF